uniref:Uncharacterized protein n=1 Tax=Arundo donax TaxID=35708 RepID=A0A0A9BX54_ARUDO
MSSVKHSVANFPISLRIFTLFPFAIAASNSSLNPFPFAQALRKVPMRLMSPCFTLLLVISSKRTAPKL